MSDNESTEEVIECPACQDSTPKDECLLTPDEELWCENCFHEAYSFCDWCEEYGDADYFASVYNADDREIIICRECRIFSGDFVSCAECGEFVYYEAMFYHEDSDSSYCSQCSPPESDAHWIRHYHDNPEFVFINDGGDSEYNMAPGQYYLGVEVELECAVNALEQNGFKPESESFRNLWACRDGSLGSDGVEIISMPGTLEAWRKGYVIPWHEWHDQVHAIIPEQSQFTDNGIHVHVSRQAFNRGVFNGHRGFKESAAHLFKFLMFIERNELVMHTLGGRQRRSSYAKFDAKDAKANRKRIVKKEAYADRYNIVNVGNRYTIELRFFDGRSEPIFIQRAVELTHAMVEYTRGVQSKSSSMEFKSFMEWVKIRRAVYPELWAHIIANEFQLESIANQSQLDYEAMTYGIKSKALDIQDRFERNRIIAAQAMNNDDDSSWETDAGVCDCGFCSVLNG